MFQAFFNSLSGMFSFSRSLDTVSNNVSNMNTPGFRGSDTFFQSVTGGAGEQAGFGTQITDTALRTTQGEIRQTGNATDLALSGSGFFVLRDDAGNTFYTRAGQFSFDDEGILVDTVTGHRVAGVDAAGNLVDISIADLRTLPPEATTTVNLVGNLSSASATHAVNNVQVFDAQGASHTLSVQFTNNTAVTAGSWLVSVRDASNAVIGSGEVRFGVDGSPTAGFNSVTATITVAGVPQTFTFQLGAPGGFSGATAFSGTPNSLGARVVDGHGLIGLTSLSFDEDGVIQLTYSNGDEQEGQQVAVAFFADEHSLQVADGRLYTSADAATAEIGRPGEGKFAKVVGGSLELSNVDLTQEFADMIIIQRGYQASSRVLSISNEMVEQLYNSTRNG